MWPFRPRQPRHPAEDDREWIHSSEAATQRKALKRKAGCLWGCLTEPFVAIGLTVVAVVFGHACLTRRAARQRDAEGKDATHE